MVVVVVAWNPSGTKVATGSQDANLRIIDAGTGAIENVVDHHSRVGAAAWNPAGTKLATGSDDSQLRIVNAETGVVERELGHTSGVNSVAWNPAGTKLATGCGVRERPLAGLRLQ